MEKIRKKLFCLLLLPFCVFISFCGCQSSPSLPDYRQSAFYAELRLITPSVTVSGYATVSLPKDSAQRDVTLVFSEPKALEDVTLTRSNGIVSLQYDGLVLEEQALEALLFMVDLLTSSRERRIVSQTEEYGEPLILAELLPAGNEKSYELYLDPNSGAPRMLRSEDITLVIRSFRLISEAQEEKSLS